MSTTYVVKDSATMLRRNLLHIRRYPSLSIMLVAQPILFLLLFVYVFGGTLGAGLGGPGGGRADYLAYVTPGILLIAVAGVAWAQHRGIRRVEVQVDDGAWQECRLGGVPSVDTWRQWVYHWDATPGRHRLRVRATDGSGQVQPERAQDAFPSGATGWHTITVTVR